MNSQILFYTDNDGSVRMTIPNSWIVWRNVMNSENKRTFLREEYRHIMDLPGVTFQDHYLQLRFDNEEVAIQFKLSYL